MPFSEPGARIKPHFASVPGCLNIEFLDYKAPKHKPTEETVICTNNVGKTGCVEMVHQHQT